MYEIIKIILISYEKKRYCVFPVIDWHFTAQDISCTDSRKGQEKTGHEMVFISGYLIWYSMNFLSDFFTYRYIPFWLDIKIIFLFCRKAWRFLTCKFYTPLIGTWYMWSNRWNESSQQLNYIMNIYSLLQAKKSLFLKRAGLHKNHRQFRNNIAKNI